MPLPDDVPTFTLVGQFPPLSSDGPERVGKLIFSPEPPVLVSDEGVYLGQETAVLENGGFTKTLVANDAFDEPFVWHVLGVIEGQVPLVWDLSVPASAGTVHLGTVTTVPVPKTDYVVIPGPVGPAGPDPAGAYLPLVGGVLNGSLAASGYVYANTHGAPTYAALPKGVTGRSENAGLAVGSSYAGGDDDGTGTDSTGRLNLYSYQRANVGSFGETARNFLMRKDAKAMTAWYGPQSGTAANYDGNRDWTAGSSPKPWVWTGAHYEANDHGSIHGHWEVEVPDSTGALQGRLEIPFVDQENAPGTIGVDVTNIRTNLADFSVRASNGQVLRVGAANQYNKDILLSISSDRATTGRRWAVRATSETESGANTGTNFQLVRYDDTGTFVDSPIVVSRSTGNVTLGPGLVARRASASVSSVSLNTTSLGAGAGVIGVGNAATVPSTNPTGGGVLYAEGGALKWRGPSGQVTTIGLA